LSVAGRTRELPLGLPSATLAGARVILPLLAICSLPVLFYVPFLNEPFMRDEGFFASVGQLVLDGGMPYRDAFDNKPPLIFGWYALSFLFFGETVWAPRLLAALLLSGTTLLVYMQGRLMFSRRAGLVAAAAFGLSMGLAEFETNANVEYFLLAPMVAALVSFTLGERSGRLSWYVAAGFFSAVAILTKQTAVFNLLFFLLLLAVPVARRDGWRLWKSSGLLRKSGALMIGCAAAAALVAAPFLVTGTLPEMLEAVVLYSGDYVATVSPLTKLWIMVRSPLYVLTISGPLAVLAALGAAHLLKSRHRDALLAMGWLLSSVLAIAVAGRFYQHYYVMLLPGAALLVPPGITWLRSRWDRPPARVIALGVLPALLGLSLLINGQIYLQPSPEERHVQKFANHPMREWEVESPKLAAWLREHTSEDDLIYNLGFQSEVYFYADRRSASRFLFDNPFAVNRDLEDEAIRDLAENRPLYIFDSAVYEPDDWLANYYPERVRRFIEENYEYLGKLYYADLFRLRDQTIRAGAGP
jgi:hypothetical protein